jgi:hypothetical protein
VKHLLATLAIAFSTALIALGGASPAGAGGKPSYGCPPDFIGPLTLQQYLDLPRNQAGFAAGVYDVNNRGSLFHEVDLNHDGMICAKDVASLGSVNSADGWQYAYNLVDDDASVPTG